MKRKLTVPEQHQLRVIKQILNMPDAMIPFSGYSGTKEDALKAYKKLTEKEWKDK